MEFTFAVGRDQSGPYTRCLGCGEKFRDASPAGFMPVTRAPE